MRINSEAGWSFPMHGLPAEVHGLPPEVLEPHAACTAAHQGPAPLRASATDLGGNGRYTKEHLEMRRAMRALLREACATLSTWPP
jgi:hypothetical protein